MTDHQLLLILWAIFASHVIHPIVSWVIGAALAVSLFFI